jgi:hypothetical protein
MRYDRKVDLTALRGELLTRIDVEAEDMRTRFVTPGSAQSMVSMEKRQEAELFMTNPEVSPALVPHLVSEAAMAGVDVFDIAVDVLTMAERWKVVSALIESRRLAAKSAVRDAETAMTARAAARVDWSDIEAYSGSAV